MSKRVIDEENVYRRLKIFIPLVQVLLVLGSFVSYKLSVGADALIWYALPARDIVVKLNFPLLIAWSPILYLMERFSGDLNASNSVVRVTGLVAVSSAALASVALFWYVVVVETETRRRGSSIIRFESGFCEMVKIFGLFLCGMGAFAYAYVDGRRLILLDRSRADAFVGGLFLVTWGATLTCIAINDFVIFMRKSRHSSVT